AHPKVDCPGRMILGPDQRRGPKMQQLLSGISSSVNSSVNGCGVKHLKLSSQERIALAADIATGVRPFEPSLTQTCVVLDIPVAAVRGEIKRRSAANGSDPAEASPAVMAAALVDIVGLDTAVDLLIAADNRR